MKENQDKEVFYSKSFTVETGPPPLKSHEIYEPNGFRTNIDAFETKIGDENHNDVDVILIDNEGGTLDSPSKDSRSRLLDNVRDLEKDSDTLSHFICEKESRKQIIIEHESSVTFKEFLFCNEDEYSSSGRDGVSNLFEKVMYPFTDKNVLECELPELEIMKDICVDNGRSNDDKEMFTLYPDTIKETSSMEVDNNHAAIQCEAKGSNDGNCIDQENIESYPFRSSEIYTAKNCDPLALVQIAEDKFAPTNNSEEDSFADEKFPIREYSNQTSLGSSLDSSDDEGSKQTQLSDQVPIQKCAPSPEGPTESSPGDGKSDEAVQPKSVLQNINININTGITTFKLTDAENTQPTVAANPYCLSVDSKIDSVSTKNGAEENAVESCPEEQGQFSSRRLTNDDKREERGDTSNGDMPSGQLHYEQGETSVYMVTHSGNLSHRSDASTASTRSFAFPVLQSEWNSSPVRMAKVDRRHFRKPKGWRSGIFCCRF